MDINTDWLLGGSRSNYFNSPLYNHNPMCLIDILTPRMFEGGRGSAISPALPFSYGIYEHGDNSGWGSENMIGIEIEMNAIDGLSPDSPDTVMTIRGYQSSANGALRNAKGNPYSIFDQVADPYTYYAPYTVMAYDLSKLDLYKRAESRGIQYEAYLNYVWRDQNRNYYRDYYGVRYYDVL